MKRSSLLLISAVSLQLLSGITYAQETAITLKSPTNTVSIDGDNKEWGDNLAYYNADQNIHYTISNDKDNLYLVIKTNDERQITSILLSGVTFSIDTKDRKKRTYSVTFPVQDRAITNHTTLKTIEEKRAAAKYTKLRKIEAKGFKDVVDDAFYAGNPYKIQPALNFDANGFLVYEEAIPLSLFHAEELMNNEWVYNVRLNAVTATLLPNGQTSVGTLTITSAIVAVPAGSSPPSSTAVSTAVSKVNRNSSSTQANQNSIAGNTAPQEVEIIKDSNFWGKFKLAQL